MELQRSAINDLKITPQQDAYIAFVACGGLLPSEGGAGHKMTATQLAEELKVDPATLWRWRQQIPDFWERVGAKRSEIGGKDRLSAVWNGVFLKAAAGNAECAKIYLKNFDTQYIDPMQKIEHEIGGSWAALLESHIKNDRNDVIEAEIVNAN